MTIFGLILSIYLIYRIIKEARKLDDIRKKLGYATGMDENKRHEEEPSEERPTEEDKVWWMFWGRHYL